MKMMKKKKRKTKMPKTNELPKMCPLPLFYSGEEASKCRFRDVVWPNVESGKRKGGSIWRKRGKCEKGGKEKEFNGLCRYI